MTLIAVHDDGNGCYDADPFVTCCKSKRLAGCEAQVKNTCANWVLMHKRTRCIAAIVFFAAK